MSNKELAKPVIYVTWTEMPQQNRIGDIKGIAIAEDGTILTGHISSSIDYLKHDLGVNSDWKHDIYKAHYPDGYTVVYVEDIPKEVLERHRQMVLSK